MVARRMPLDPNGGPLQIGARFLSKYTIQGVLGTGGHAWVYRAHDAFMQRDVAIKILHRRGGMTPDMLLRAQNEARVMIGLRHPSIVEVLDAGQTEENLVYILMELLPGRVLSAVQKEYRRLLPLEVTELMAALADGLHAAHTQPRSVIHRDIKPDNIFITPNGPKVLDFGIAKVLNAAAITERDMVLGTMLYMSPEQIQGFEVTPQTDIYSLGVVAWELLVGERLVAWQIKDSVQRGLRRLAALQPTGQDVTRVIVGEQAPMIDEVVGGVPKYLARHIFRMTAKRRSQRLQSMREVADGFREVRTRYLAELEAAGAPVDRRELARAQAMSSHAVVSSRPAVIQRLPVTQDTAPVSHQPFSGPPSSVPFDQLPTAEVRDVGDQPQMPPQPTAKVGRQREATRGEADERTAELSPEAAKRLAELARAGEANSGELRSPITEPLGSPRERPRSRPEIPVAKITWDDPPAPVRAEEPLGPVRVPAVRNPLSAAERRAAKARTQPSARKLMTPSTAPPVSTGVFRVDAGAPGATMMTARRVVAAGAIVGALVGGLGVLKWLHAPGRVALAAGVPSALAVNATSQPSVPRAAAPLVLASAVTVPADANPEAPPSVPEPPTPTPSVALKRAPAGAAPAQAAKPAAPSKHDSPTLGQHGPAVGSGLDSDPGPKPASAVHRSIY